MFLHQCTGALIYTLPGVVREGSYTVQDPQLQWDVCLSAELNCGRWDGKLGMFDMLLSIYCMYMYIYMYTYIVSTVFISSYILVKCVYL